MSEFDLAKHGPRSVQAIEWSLWAAMLPICDKCRYEIDIPHWSERPDEDVSAWAEEWAPKLYEMGWSLADDGIFLICPKCRPA